MRVTVVPSKKLELHLLGSEGFTADIRWEGHDRPGCIKMKLAVYVSVACDCIWVISRATDTHGKCELME